MTENTTLTIRLSPQVKNRLGRLADHTKRTKSQLAGEAIADFVERELALVEGVKRGIEDMRAGRVVPHETAMRRLRGTVARFAKAKS
jgi:predicted transcriptional regulator